MRPRTNWLRGCSPRSPGEQWTPSTEFYLLRASDPFPSLRECDPDVEWDLSRRGIDPEVYHGYDGWLRLLEQYRDAWQEFRMEAEKVIDAERAGQGSLISTLGYAKISS